MTFSTRPRIKRVQGAVTCDQIIIIYRRNNNIEEIIIYRRNRANGFVLIKVALCYRNVDLVKLTQMNCISGN